MFSTLYQFQSTLYKIFLFLSTLALIVYLFPKGGTFKYEFSKGKPWQYENLYAPFDFAIIKTEAELAAEKQKIIADVIPYFQFDTLKARNTKQKYDTEFTEYVASLPESISKEQAKAFGQKILNEIYEYGVVDKVYAYAPNQLLFLKRGNEAEEIRYEQLFTSEKLRNYITEQLARSEYAPLSSAFLALYFESIEPNVYYNETLSESVLQNELSQMITTRGNISKESRIIAKGEVVEGEKLNMLNSLKQEYESQVWSDNNVFWIIFGYSVLIALVLFMLFIYIYKYRPNIFSNNTKFTFIIFNIVAVVLITIAMIKYDATYVYIIPVCILPLIIKAFFDSEVGLFSLIVTVLILGFIVPNSYEYIFLHVIAGMVTMLTITGSYKRANLFIAVGQITIVYLCAYIAFHIIHEGSLNHLDLKIVKNFVLSGLITLIAHPLIYSYEKVFGLVSDVSLLELSDTNSGILKELSDKAPGTFHHSLNVANIAEAAAHEIGANALLIRVGALYHDIGKMEAPTYFTENQSASGNAHDTLSSKESAKIIIAHVIKGIEIAKKHNLPDRVIDFIRTHHGTSLVYYFYRKEKENNPEVDLKDFQYPGPKPFSKETAILMMSDSVEAASKSLKNPTSSLIETFVDKIINKQMEEGQFINADITFKEIQQIKKVFKRKLTNIYHLRIEYPE